jgi:hypothetical protein
MVNYDSQLPVNEAPFLEGAELDWYEPRRAPFQILGLHDILGTPFFKRLPLEVASATSPGVSGLNKNPSGGRIRFATDSTCIAVDLKYTTLALRANLPNFTTAAFDIYEEAHGSEIYLATIRYPLDSPTGYTAKFDIPGNPRMRQITMYFPLYNEVRDLKLGFSRGASVAPYGGRPYENELPVVYYGSSITQGASASRSALSYQAIISRRYNLDFINLGFAGNAKGEDAIVEYMSTMPMCAFVSDYDHNAPTPEHLEATHKKMYDRIREKNPTIPYIMISRPTVNYANVDAIRRRNIIYDTYRAAFESGDRNVYFVDGFSLFGDDPDKSCTIDTCHPTDLGFSRMAERIGCVLDYALKHIKK